MTKQEALKYVIEELEEAASVTSYGQEEHDHIDKLREARDTLALILIEVTQRLLNKEKN